MDSLFILQFACCIATTMLMGILACSGFLIKWRRRRYEVSRWLLCASMFMLAVHYILQMKYGLRASGDDVGAVVNILFYSPVALMMFYAIYNLECAKAARKIFLCYGIADYALILTTFAIGRSVSGSMHIGKFLYVMLALFLVGMAAAVWINLRIIIERRRHVEAQASMEMKIYNRFSVSSFIVICVSAIMIPAAIIYRPMLFVVGPILLLSFFVFVLCFIALGYDDVKTIADMAELADAAEAYGLDGLQVFTEERMVQIEKALGEWCMSGGYRDSMASVATVADSICVPRQELASYFDMCIHTTFRTWLSDVRFEHAKLMLRDKKNYNIEAISSYCGFVSHTQLYRLFKTNTGMSPEQWRKSFSSK